jgi:hypothetical protein
MENYTLPSVSQLVALRNIIALRNVENIRFDKEYGYVYFTINGEEYRISRNGDIEASGWRFLCTRQNVTTYF